MVSTRHLSRSLLFYLSVIVITLLVDWRVLATAEKPTVAIVGAGIGGTSCAYYLKKFLPDVTTVILEADSRIGGRVYDATVDGEVFVIGTYAWSGQHRYIAELAEELGLEATGTNVDGVPDFVSPFGFTSWNGTHLFDTAELEKAHNDSMDVLARGTTDYYARVLANYDLRGDETFATMQEFLSKGNLGDWPTLESGSYFTEEGVALEMQELAMAPMHNAYHSEGMNSHVFAMYTILSVRMGGGRVVGGNANLVTSLAEASSAKIFLNSTVKTVEKLPKGFNVKYETADTRYDVYADYVVIAAPLEVTGINFSNFDAPIHKPAKKWHEWHTYILTADEIKREYFTTYPNNASLSTVNCNPCQPIVYHRSRTIDDATYYKIIAFQDIADDLEDIFVNPSVKYKHTWPYGHPVLEPFTAGGASYQDVILSPGLYNLGVMNDLMDQMEGSVIAARNAALLIKKDSQGVSGAVAHYPTFLPIFLYVVIPSVVSVCC